MEFRILGPLQARERGRQLELGAAKQRSLLGVLLLHANKAVSSERLVDELWGERPPARAAKLVQGHVSALRKLLGGDRILTESPGYLVRVEAGELDLDQFEGAVAEARGQPPERVAELLRAALALWRGPALADLRLEGFAAREAERLNDVRLAALLERIEADLALGRHAQVVGELETLVAEHPLQERPRGQLMLALYRAGRQADALALYRDTRTLLSDDLGLEPQEELQRLHREMLAHDPQLDLPRPKPRAELPAHALAPAADAPERVRRRVSVVFADLVGSTTLAERLDPESLHGVLTRYSAACADVLERHGGTVEKFLGDAVVAVFGLPSLHEDDALRAVRAAVELRQAVADLSGDLEAAWGVGIDVTVAVNSGEVFVAAGSRRESFASGDALNVAARLEQSADPGDIVVGEQTHRLVEHLVRAEPLEPLAVKGRAAKVQAWRLLELPEEPVRPPAAPFVGRERELTELEQALARTTAEKACLLCTVLGPPGIGKSRLARELIEAVGDRAFVVVGRCPSYGAGITYLPLAEVVRQLGRDPVARIAELLAGDERAELLAGIVLGTAGLAEGQSQAQDTAWAFRRLFEALARERPLVAVFEDVHWAEPALLDLLDSVVGFSSGAPILLLCLARPELLEQRPSWVNPQPNRTVLGLEPLLEADARRLVNNIVPHDLDPGARARIVETAEGNPLFLEQLTAVHAEGPEPILPPSIQAVLAARIDRLDPGERTVLERASVEGRSFHRGAVAELLPQTERAALGSRLIALVSKQLIRPDRPQLAGEDGFRFAHVLIREAAYEGLPKQLRAQLHEQIADWLDKNPDAADEIVGYHLEQACRYHAELGLPSDDELTTAARRRLTAAGRRAMVRGDSGAAVRLLERAIALVPPAELDLALELDFVDALLRAGKGGEALRRADALAERASAAGDRVGELCGKIKADVIHLYREPEGATEKLAALVEQALPVFEAAGDDLALYLGYFALGHVVAESARMDAALDAFERAFAHARRAGLPYQLLPARAVSRFTGTTPVSELLAWLDEQKARGEWDYYLRIPRAHALAMLGRFDEARVLLAEARAQLADRSGQLAFALTMASSAQFELLAGDPATAVEFGEEAFRLLGELGEKYGQASAAVNLARALSVLDRLEEADAWARRAAELGASHHAQNEMLLRQVRAKVLARRSEHDKAERFAREAVAVGEDTDWLDGQGDAHADLAEVLLLAGKPDEAAAALEQALERYKRKGNLVSTHRTQARLAELRHAAPR